MKPTFIAAYFALTNEFNKIPSKYVLAYDLHYENTEFNPTDFIGFEINNYEFNFMKVANGPKQFWVQPNAVDPENPVSVEQMVQNLIAAMDDAQPDINDPSTLLIKNMDEPIHSYYGQYVDSLAEAITLTEVWANTPVCEWPKDYNKPVDIDQNGLIFEIKRLE